MISLVKEAIIAGSCYGLWAASFSSCAAPQKAFNLAPVIAGFAGCYAAVLVARQYGNVWLAVASACAVGVALSVAVQLLVVGPLLRRRNAGRSVLLATLGFLGVVQALLSIAFGSELVGLRQIEVMRATLAPLAGDSSAWIWHGGILALAALALSAGIWMTERGLVFRACSDNRVSAVFFRLPVRLNDLIAAAVGGLLAGTAGFLRVATRAVGPYEALTVVVSAVAGAILGGLKNPVHALVGGVVLGFFEVMALRQFSSDIRDVLVGSAMVVMLILKPRGLLGAAGRAA